MNKFRERYQHFLDSDHNEKKPKILPRHQDLYEDLFTTISSDEEIRQAMGRTQIAFWDFENMSTATQVLYMLGFFGLIGLVAFLVWKNLLEKEPDFNAIRRDMINQKKESRGKKKNN